MWILKRSESRKNISEPRLAAGRYISRAFSMTISVCLAMTIFSATSIDVAFESSRFSMSAMFSVTSPSALASCSRMPSSSSVSLILKLFCCWMSSSFCAARSGRSSSTTFARSWSSRPSSVTMKLTGLAIERRLRLDLGRVVRVGELRLQVELELARGSRPPCRRA